MNDKIALGFLTVVIDSCCSLMKFTILDFIFNVSCITRQKTLIIKLTRQSSFVH